MARGLLFVALALGLGLIAVAALRASAWPVGVAAGILAAWMGDLALRDLGLCGMRRRRPRR